MEVEQTETPGPALSHPYLQALHAAQVPAPRLLAEAEGLGFAPAELLALADQLLGQAPGGTAMPSVLLALAAARNWEPFASLALGFGVRLFEPIVHGQCSDLDALVAILPEGDWEELCTTALRRLGYPGRPGHARGAGARDSALPWLDRDRPLVLRDLELDHFATKAPAWNQVQVEALSLRDGVGPRRLAQAPGARWRYPADHRSLRLFRVARLRTLEGLRQVAGLVAVGCPDLENLDDAPPCLVLRDCPSLRRLPPLRRSRLLHLEDCPGLRSLGGPGEEEGPPADGAAPAFHNVILSRCAALRELPWRMHVTGHLLLRGLGPIHRWPSAFQVGGDLRLRDCPAFEELPVLEVRGNLVVAGASGLRRLAPGTVVGRHLDLRACTQLEGLPRGVKVGGATFLPEHLHRQPERFEAPEPLLDLPVDHYPVLRTVLLGLGFPALARTGERLAARQRAEAALEDLRLELRRDPRIENELLWTASEVWRDLAEAWWAEEHPLVCDRNEADDDLPLAWFRGLLLAS